MKLAACLASFALVSAVNVHAGFVTFYDGAPQGTPQTPDHPVEAPTYFYYPTGGGNGGGGTGGFGAVPEPGTALFGLALLGVAAIRRRR